MTRRRIRRRAADSIPPAWTVNSFQGASAPHEHAAIPAGSRRPPRSTFLSRGVLWEVGRLLLEICPDAHDGGDCRFYTRMRDKLIGVPFACWTKHGLCSFFASVFVVVEGDPDPSSAFNVFTPMVRPIVHSFWSGCASRNDLVPYNECQQHSPTGLACRECVETHPYFGDEP